MKLPTTFQFSQSSLQDFIDCPRRFELRHLLKVKWPAPISEPVIEFERHIQQGLAFHQMVQQYASGVPVDKINASTRDADLVAWWQNFVTISPTSKFIGPAFPEFRLSIPFSGSRLVAQFDLLILDQSGKVIIFDWKTSRVHPRKNTVSRKVQSRLYPFLLAEGGLHSSPISPDQIRMIYWYPNFPAKPDEIIYTRDQYQQDRNFIDQTIKAILERSPGKFDLTPDLKACTFCNYRSLCNRGEKAGDWSEMEDIDNAASENSFDLDMNNIPEIEF